MDSDTAAKLIATLVAHKGYSCTTQRLLETTPTEYDLVATRHVCNQVLDEIFDAIRQYHNIAVNAQVVTLLKECPDCKGKKTYQGLGTVAIKLPKSY